MKHLSLILLLFFGIGCSKTTKKNVVVPKKIITKKIASKKEKSLLKKNPEKVLTEKNAIPFLFEYQQQPLPKQVEISTSFGEIVIALFDEAPYHKANFIYLTRLGYFDNPSFIGSSPTLSFKVETPIIPTPPKRRLIGRYLLPRHPRKRSRSGCCLHAQQRHGQSSSTRFSL